MTKLRILGSCSGTEPMPGRRHTAIAVTAGERVYFFDAGEGCAHNAHLAGIDLLKLRAIFISHTHFDHIGGLAGLLWHTRKLTSRRKENVADGDIQLYIPQLECWDAIRQLLGYTESSFKTKFTITPQRPAFGAFYEDENLRVSGYRSYHIPETDGMCRAYSYRLDFPDRSVVFSGDVKQPQDLVDAVGTGCDVLLMETGHHKVADVCRFAAEHNVGELVLIHHGREILNEEPSVQEAIAACPVKTTVSHDGTELCW